MTSMSVLCYLTTHFIDRYHYRLEEDVLFSLALARGANPKIIQRVLDEHDEGRSYFRGMEVALRRIREDNADAIADFRRCTAGFVDLYKAHGPYENDVVLPEIGHRLSDADDVLLSNLLRQAGPPDVSPYVGLIQVMEQELGVTP